MMTIRELSKVFNFEIRDFQLFLNAFTHSSYAFETKDVSDYERVEYIGDAVLYLVIADLIYNEYPKMKQGDMSKLRSQLVCSATLAEKAKEYHFDDIIRVGHGVKKEGGANQKILEDVFESFIGAIYIDQGFEIAKRIVLDIFKEDLDNFDIDSLTDYKSKLQIYLQSNYRGNINYRVLKESGTSQNKHFVIEVSMLMDNNTIILGVGEGRSKKQAEQAAAKAALAKKAGNE